MKSPQGIHTGTRQAPLLRRELFAAIWRNTGETACTSVLLRKLSDAQEEEVGDASRETPFLPSTWQDLRNAAGTSRRIPNPTRAGAAKRRARPPPAAARSQSLPPPRPPRRSGPHS